MSSRGKRTKPKPKRGYRVTWVKGHCRRRPTAGWVKRDRAKSDMPF